MIMTYRGSALPLAGALVALVVGCGESQIGEGGVAAARVDDTPTYLALGDSIAFGLDPHLVPEVSFSCFSCDTFTATAPPESGDVFVGYPELLHRRLGFALENASCPGETSVSWGARVTTGQAQICNTFKRRDWLHASYSTTQRRYGLDFLARHPRVELVTFQLGANDVLDLVASCRSDPACVNAGIGAVLATVYANANGALSTLRAAGYRGTIVVPSYYAPAPAWIDVVSALNSYLALAASANDAVSVDLLALFGPDPCGAGLLLPVDPLDPAAGCDFHPSEAGARLISTAIATAVAR